MRKPLLAALAALTFTLAPASAVLAQETEDPSLPDNPVTDDNNKDKDNFDDWGLLGLLGLLGLGGLAKKKASNDTTVTRRTSVNERDTGTGTAGGASTR